MHDIVQDTVEKTNDLMKIMMPKQRPVISQELKTSTKKFIQAVKNADPSEGDTTPTSKDNQQANRATSAEGDVGPSVDPILKAPKKAKKKLYYLQGKENMMICPHRRTIVERNKWDLSFKTVREASKIEQLGFREADTSIYDFEWLQEELLETMIISFSNKPLYSKIHIDLLPEKGVPPEDNSFIYFLCKNIMEVCNDDDGKFDEINDLRDDRLDIDFRQWL